MMDEEPAVRMRKEMGILNFSFSYYEKNGEDMINELQVYCVSKQGSVLPRVVLGYHCEGQ